MKITASTTIWGLTKFLREAENLGKHDCVQIVLFGDGSGHFKTGYTSDKAAPEHSFDSSTFSEVAAQLLPTRPKMRLTLSDGKVLYVDGAVKAEAL